jgi:hypothetical protein
MSTTNGTAATPHHNLARATTLIEETVTAKTTTESDVEISKVKFS